MVVHWKDADLDVGRMSDRFRHNLFSLRSFSILPRQGVRALQRQEERALPRQGVRGFQRQEERGLPGQAVHPLQR